jgi:hypothetical protein
VFVAAAVGACISDVRGAFIFTKIADSTSPLVSSIEEAPAINASGVVAFEARNDALKFNVVRGNGGALTPIVEVADSSASFQGVPSIDVSGRVLVNTGSALVVGDGTTLTTPYVGGAGGIGSIGSGAVVRNGRIAFAGVLSTAGFERVLRGDLAGGPVTTVAMNAAPYPFSSVSTARPSMNDAGVVAFNAGLASGTGIFKTDAGGVYTTIATSAGPFAIFSPSAAINDAGLVAFAATGDDNVRHVYIGDGVNPLIPIADSTGAYSNFGTPAINDVGDIAFWAELDGVGNWGIFRGPDPVADKVIKTGDPLFGSTVAQFYGTDLPNALNDARQLAFAARLTNGQFVVARVQIPEPAAGTMLGVGAAMVLRRRCRRRRAS